MKQNHLTININYQLYISLSFFEDFVVQARTLLLLQPLGISIPCRTIPNYLALHPTATDSCADTLDQDILNNCNSSTISISNISFSYYHLYCPSSRNSSNIFPHDVLTSCDKSMVHNYSNSLTYTPIFLACLSIPSLLDVLVNSEVIQACLCSDEGGWRKAYNHTEMSLLIHAH